jgi:isocitrate dehydrogenase
MATYRYATVPAQGERIEYSSGSLRVPPNRGLESAIKLKRVTYDLAPQMPGATEISTSAFGDQVIRSMPA